MKTETEKKSTLVAQTLGFILEALGSENQDAMIKISLEILWETGAIAGINSCKGKI